MILTKKFECTTEDVDSIVVAIAKEIENGWSVHRIELHDHDISYSLKRTKPEFSIELIRKDKEYER